MSFLSQFHVMTNGDFIGRVGVACLSAAVQISQEEGFDRNEPKNSRHRLAAAVDAGYQTGIDHFVRACALNSSISAAEDAEPNSSKDDDLQYVVNSVWDTVAEINFGS